MLIGTSTDLYHDTKKEKKSIVDLAKVGFQAFDYSYFWHDNDKSLYLKDDFTSYAKEIYELAKEHNTIFSQMHAPMFADFFKDKHEDRKMELTLRAFEVCSIIKSPYLVVHTRKFGEGITMYEREKAIEYNMQFMKDLLPYAKKYNVKIALENLFSLDKKANKINSNNRGLAEEMLYFINALGADYFVACLDTGHARLTSQSCADIARQLGDNLKILHIHDNFGVSDDHLFPYFGVIDWEDFYIALKEIKYSGVLSMEANSVFSKLPQDLAIESAKYLFAIGKFMVNKIAAYNI